MQITASHDFKANRAKVLARFRDPDRIEEVLGALADQLDRTAEAPSPAWRGSVKWRGSPRPLTMTLRETTPNAALTLDIKADIGDATVVFRFADLPGGGCRVTAGATPLPRGVVARVAVASMGLVRTKLSKRLARLVAALGKA